MSLTYSDVKENELISSKVLNDIQETCLCGSDIVFSESLSQVFCSNNVCYFKIAKRVALMLEYCGYFDYSIDTIEFICKQTGIESPFQIIEVVNGIEPESSSAEVAYIVKAIKDIGSREFYTWQVAKLIGISNISNVAYKLFGGYNDIEDAYSSIEAGQANIIADKLGIKSADSTVLAVSVYNSLVAYKDELIYGQMVLNIINNGLMPIQIAIENIIGYTNKSEFLSIIDSKYGSKANIILVSRVTKDTDILVVDGIRSSNRYKAAAKINNAYREYIIRNKSDRLSELDTFVDDSVHTFGEKILIGTSKEVIERLDRVILGRW